MNIKHPLAAALLMTASVSFAEPYALPNLGGGSLLGNLNNFSLIPQGPADDSIFTCGSSCTPAQKKQLDAIRQSGFCPQPATKTCTDYVMKLGVCVAANPTETIAAYTPPPDTEWASPTCTRIPCRTKSSPGGDNEGNNTASSTAGLPPQKHVPVPGDADFMGPVQSQPAIQPFKDDEEYKAALKMQQEASPNSKIIEMGDRRFAVLSEDGQEASMNGRCSGGPCSGMPKPVASIPGLQKKIDEAAKVKSLADNEGTPKNGQTKEEAAVDRPDTNGKAAPISAFNLGAGFGADIASTGGGSSLSGGTTGGDAAGSVKAIPATQEMRAKMNEGGYTYGKIGEAADASVKIIQGGAASFDTTNGRTGEPPVGDGKYLGKIQAVENSAP